MELINDRLKALSNEQRMLLEKKLKEKSINLSAKVLGDDRYKTINAVEEREYYIASSAQKRMYLINKMTGEQTAYNIPSAYIIEGKVDINTFEECFRILIKRHEALRTSFATIDNEIVQKIHKNVDFNITYSELDEENIDIAINEFIKPFDLTQAPLFRVSLLKLSEDRYLFLNDMHHIISDGTSMGILVRDLADIYNGEPLKENRLQYRDYSVWQNELLKSGVIQKQEEYWTNLLSGELPVLNLPEDFPRPNVRSFEGSSVEFEVGAELTGKLNTIAKETGSTLYMVLVAAYNILLKKYTGQNDIIVGTPVAGRLNADLQNIIGMFVNTLVLRNFPEGEKTFTDFLKEVRQNALKAYENQDYQFEDLVDKLNFKRDMTRNPLFDTMFVLQNMQSDAAQIGSLRFVPYKVDNQVAKFDITLDAQEYAENISFSIAYCTRLFKKETIESVSRCYVNILKEIAEDPEKRISKIEILSEEEKKQLLFDFNDTKNKYPDKTIHKLFEEQAERTPYEVAVIYEDKEITYKELNEKSNRVARELIKRGVSADKVVGILMDTSIEMVMAIFGVLKAGGAFLPINTGHPAERVKFILEDSRAVMLLTNRSFEGKVPFGCKILSVESAINSCSDGSNIGYVSGPDDLAYIIYTSGTTGKPKGVMIEHRGIYNTIMFRKELFQLNKDDVTLQLFSYSFDGFMTSFFTPVVSGATVVLLNEIGVKDPHALRNSIVKYGVTHFIMVPPLYKALLELLEPQDMKSLRIVVLAADKLSLAIVSESKQKNPELEIVNEYGPTECSVLSTLSRGIRTDSPITIGKPISNIMVHIVDKDNALVPLMVAGELCLSGVGLARGYVNNTELTNEKFVPNPFLEGERMYKTGDLARWLPDGSIEFMGRIDHQVKIRGYRIEPSEIENRLLEHGAVKSAVVVDREDENGNKYLCAYVVELSEVDVIELKEFLLLEFAEYMIPSFFVKLDEIPVSPNGKIDRKALPEPDRSHAVTNQYVASKNNMEHNIVKVWERVLGMENIGTNDNFFELGGDSIKAIQVVSMLSVNYDVSINDLFEHPTIAKLAQNVSYNKDKLKRKIEEIKLFMSNPSDAALNQAPNEKLEADLQAYYRQNDKYKNLDLSLKKDYKNILLIGGSGYLGMHILYDLLSGTATNVYLLVRGRDINEAKERILSKFKYYFEEYTFEKFKDRIFIFNGDLAMECFGLDQKVYAELTCKIDCVINSAANVRHYGHFKDFYNINVEGTRRIVDFANSEIKKDIHHISTMSVGMGKIEGKEYQLFTEYSADLGQNTNSNYINTKLEAESLLYKARNEGLKINIYRVGNLVFDYNSGIFQENIAENWFYSEMKAYLKLGFVPDISEKTMEFSFVDFVSKAILLLFDRSELENETYHIMNNYNISISDLGKFIKSSGYDLDILHFEKFMDYIYDNYNNESIREYIYILLNNFLESPQEAQTVFVKKCDKTNLLLKQLGFSWVTPSELNIERMIKHCEKVGFLESPK